MIEKLTTEKIPEWAICYFWNGELEGLTNGEIEAMQELIFALILVTVTYVVAATIKEKTLPESISAIVYTFGKAGRWTWTLFIFICAFLLAPPLIEALDEPYQPIGFITAASLAFCGAMPLVMNEPNTGHYICGIIAGASSQISIMFFCWPECLCIWMICAIPIIPLSMTDSFERSYVFYIEAFCWCSTMTALLIHYNII